MKYCIPTYLNQYVEQQKEFKLLTEMSLEYTT